MDRSPRPDDDADALPDTFEPTPVRRRLKVDLSALSDAFETAVDGTSAFLDLETGQVEFVTDEVRLELDRIYVEIDDSENLDEAFAEALRRREFPEWMRQAVEDANRVEVGFGTRFVRVEPDTTRDAYDDMEAFIPSVSGARLQERLWRAIEGRGAFRRFRDTLADHPAEQKRWFTFRDSRMRQRLLDWLASEGVEPILE